MNPPERIRWTDARLDDRFETVSGELRALRDVPRAMGEVAVEFRHLKDDTDALHAALREIREEFQSYRADQDRAHEAHRLERKSDRRWMIGTVLSSAALVIAAMGLLLGQLN